VGEAQLVTSATEKARTKPKKLCLFIAASFGAESFLLLHSTANHPANQIFARNPILC
jgi:hypothetical protein